MKRTGEKEDNNDEKLSLSWKNKANLPEAKMGLSVIYIKNYKEKRCFPPPKNKANSKPISSPHTRFKTA